MSLSNASVVRLAKSAPLLAARQRIQANRLIEQAIAIQQIPAPTFEEQRRADYVQACFDKLGLHAVEQDSLFNVYGWLNVPRLNHPTLLVAAHTDTVFPMETDLGITHIGSQIHGAGLGDNSVGVAALLTLAELFLTQNIPHEANICFVANTREESLGDLGGINAVLDHLGQVQAGIIIEGMALGRIYHAGIAVRRYKIQVNGAGGHSWLHFGVPSAIHQLTRFIADLTSLEISAHPRTTYNVGIIEGGSSINTIAAQAACWLDLRSEDSLTLVGLEQLLHKLALKHSCDGLTFELTQVGNRPAGEIPPHHPLVRLAQAASQEIRMMAGLESGSTDANALLARQIPAVCVGITHGGNAHTTAEYIESDPIEKGMWQLLLLTAAASNTL